MYLRLLLERKIALLVQILVAPIYALIKSVEDNQIFSMKFGLLIKIVLH